MPAGFFLGGNWFLTGRCVWRRWKARRRDPPSISGLGPLFEWLNGVVGILRLRSSSSSAALFPVVQLFDPSVWWFGASVHCRFWLWWFWWWREVHFGLLVGSTVAELVVGILICWFVVAEEVVCGLVWWCIRLGLGFYFVGAY